MLGGEITKPISTIVNLFTNPIVAGVAGAIISKLFSLVYTKYREKQLDKLAQGGCAKRGAAPAEYIATLERFITLAKDSIFLTCFVTPFWFQKNGTREAILRFYERANAQNKKRIVVLSKKEIKRLKKKVDKHQQKYSKNKIDWFTTTNTFPCYWGRKEGIQKQYNIKKDILLEDYALFDGQFVIRYIFEKKILIIGGEDNLLRRAVKMFSDLNKLSDSKITFNKFNELYQYMIEHK